jgi:hypothetical protein
VRLVLIDHISASIDISIKQVCVCAACAALQRYWAGRGQTSCFGADEDARHEETVPGEFNGVLKIPGTRQVDTVSILKRNLGFA